MLELHRICRIYTVYTRIYTKTRCTHYTHFQLFEYTQEYTRFLNTRIYTKYTVTWNNRDSHCSYRIPATDHAQLRHILQRPVTEVNAVC
jgi:hypothetical protein